MVSQPQLPIVGIRSFRGLAILVVEDHADSREFLVALLEGHGATVLVAEAARSALDLLRDHRPDAVISDVGLPNEDGYDLVRRIRRLEHADGGTTPALAVTAFAGPEHRRAALAAGFDDYLTKPVDVAELLEALERLLRGPRSALR